MSSALGRWDVGLGIIIPGGIEALGFCASLVEAPLHCGLVAIELEEGSGGVGVQTELRSGAAVALSPFVRLGYRQNLESACAGR